MIYLEIGLLLLAPVGFCLLWDHYRFICAKKRHPINEILARPLPSLSRRSGPPPNKPD